MRLSTAGLGYLAALLWFSVLTLAVFVYQQMYQHPATASATLTPGVIATASAASQNSLIRITLPPTWTATPVIVTVAAAAPPQSTRTPLPQASPTPSPAPAFPKTIGLSLGRRPLVVHRFGNGPSVRTIIAGIHGGNEWNTVQLAEELITYLEENPAFVPAHVTLYILPVMNPDGLARARSVDGRVNDNGVDLNRNFPFFWHADWPRAGCWRYRPTTGGAYALSEPEAAAVANFVMTYPPDALISYHSAALGIFAGGRPTLPASERLAQAIAAVSPYPYPPIDTGCLYTGEMVDWVSSLDIPAVDIELTNHYHSDFEINLRILRVFLDWER